MLKLLSPLQFSPYCAEYEIGYSDGDQVTIWPRRPVGELTGPRLRRMIPASALEAAIALYNNHDACLHEYHAWIEKMLGVDLVLKKRPSREYKRLYDALLLPCPGPQSFSLSSFRTLGGER